MKNARPREEVESTINKIVERLTTNNVWFEVCGSYRRGKQQIGDIDIVIGSSLSDFEKYIADLEPILLSGKDKKRSYEIDDIQADIYYANPHERGAMVMFLTGSKEFNIHMRRIAKSKGLKLSQYGIFRGEIRLDTPTEESIFHCLSMSPVMPNDR